MDVALLTGTSSGIGQAAALLLARRGFRVFASMRNVQAAAPLLEAAAAEGLTLEAVTLDVASPESCAAALAEIMERAGRIDVLVNNAGIGDGTIEEATDADWRELFETNVFGPARLIRAVLPQMRERRSGAIVNVSSIAGRIALSPMDLYGPSKHALEAMSETLAQNVRRYGIRVAIVQPGFTDTPIFSKGRRIDPESPYIEFVQRYVMMIRARMAEGMNTAESVAELIHEAITTDQPRLRYAAPDAARLFESRRAMTDEQWIDYGLPMTREEFAAFSREHFGITIGGPALR